MNLTERAVKIDRKQTRMMTIYEILGKFGDRLSEDVQEELHKEAIESQKEIDKNLHNLV